MFDEVALTKQLVELGYAALENGKINGPSFGVPDEIQEWFTDLEKNPHLFLLACIANKQIKAEKAWSMPYQLHHLFSDVSFSNLETLKSEDWLKLSKQVGYRYANKTAESFELAVKLIRAQYDGNAANVWNDKPSSAEIIQRLREFKGVGQKIAAMTAQILVRAFGVEYSDYKRLDIAVDVHTRRVMKRLGLVSMNGNDQEIISKAREMNPEFPGIFDLPLWKVGRNFCHDSKPDCKMCGLKSNCLSSK
jgi:endonuclease III